MVQQREQRHERVRGDEERHVAKLDHELEVVLVQEEPTPGEGQELRVSTFLCLFVFAFLV